MNNLKIIFLLLFSMNAFAKEDACQKYYQKTDSEDFKNKSESKYRCTLNSANSSMIEMVFFPKSCQIIEGETDVDCVIVRTCPQKSSDIPLIAPAIFYNKDYLKGYCETAEFEQVLIKKEKNDFGAILKCKAGMPYKVVFQNPHGESKDCLLPIYK